MIWAIIRELGPFHIRKLVVVESLPAVAIFHHLKFPKKFGNNISFSDIDSILQLTAELLLTLYRLGWEPMTPIDLPGPKTTSTDNNGVTVVNLQTAICFRLKKNNNLSQEHLASNWTPTPSYNTSCDDISMLYPNTMGVERHDCLCLETYSENFLGFHDVPNTLLLDLVQCMSSDWQPGLTGMYSRVGLKMEKIVQLIMCE